MHIWNVGGLFARQSKEVEEIAWEAMNMEAWIEEGKGQREDPKTQLPLIWMV